MSDTDQISMFTDNNVTVSVKRPHEGVTWFDILGWGRTVNSEERGWNSKSFWVERGIDRLASFILDDGENSPIAKWTKRSTAEICNEEGEDNDMRPPPRKEDFRLTRKPEIDVSSGHPKRGKTLTRKIDSITNKTSENQLNWSCYLNEPENKTVWSYEVPLAAEQSGQLKMDLFHIGTGSDGIAIEIIELKKATGADSPLMALVESICYLCQLTRCWNALRADTEGESLKKIDLKDREIRLILAAPNEYWENACGSTKRFEDEHFEKMEKIVEVVGDTLKVKLQLFIADVKRTDEGLCEMVMREGLSNPPKPKSSVLV
jgi:hypothetical protein